MARKCAALLVHLLSSADDAVRGIPTPITGLASRHRRSARLPVARGEVKLTDPVEKYLPLKRLSSFIVCKLARWFVCAR